MIAYNSLQRAKLLKVVEKLVPYFLSYFHSAYFSRSVLFWWDNTLQSAKVIKQGVPLGPLVFCLSIHHIIAQLPSDFIKPYYLWKKGLWAATMKMSSMTSAMLKKLNGNLALQLVKCKSEVFA